MNSFRSQGWLLFWLASLMLVLMACSPASDPSLPPTPTPPTESVQIVEPTPEVVNRCQEPEWGARGAGFGRPGRGSRIRTICRR